MTRRAIAIAGTHSGSGKTTITLGLMAALMKLGHRVVPFKCGPDFIDPSLHRLVTGTTSRNLDLWMAGADFCHSCFARHSAQGDISVIEGVMGMFDGGIASTASLAKTLAIPSILVLDARSAAESAAAVLKGFEQLDPDAAPKGVIVNMIGSDRHFELVQGAIRQHCQAEILGYLPRTLAFTLPSRHLGLHMGEETPIARENIEALAQTMIEQIDMDRLLEIAGVTGNNGVMQEGDTEECHMRLAVARDRAFCFYYEDNLDILRRAGAEICFFSPLQDPCLPENIDGIYLGGGYPELHGETLARNRLLLTEIRQWAKDGGPIYAECGGFMYLSRGITDLEGGFHPLVSVFPTQAVMQTKRASLGYREMTTRVPTFFGPEATVLRGHEFHYSRIEPLCTSVERVYSVDNGSAEGYRLGNTIGGYMHLHFGFNPQAARNFIQFCTQNRKDQL